MSLKVIHCEALFDGRAIVHDAVVAIEGERITAVHTNGSHPSEIDAGAECFDCRFLMPGLIDAHLHISGYSESSPIGRPFEPIKHFLRMLIFNGITTVRDTGNTVEAIKYSRKWGEKYGGPQVFAAGPLLDRPPFMWPFSRYVENPDVAAREVKAIHGEGMDFIKVYRNIDLASLETIVRVAAEHGMNVAADVGRIPASRLSRLGVRTIEHAHNLLDTFLLPHLDGEEIHYNGRVELLKLWHRVDVAGPAVERLAAVMRENNTAVCPTLLVIHRLNSLQEMVHDPHLELMVAVMPYHQHFLRMRSRIGMMIGKKYLREYMNIPDLSSEDEAIVAAGLENIRAIVKRLHELGVTVIAGTDSPNPSVVPGFSLHQEMALMQEAGLAPVDILASATSVPADVLGQEDIGVVQVGARADLLLLNADPTQDIRHTTQIEKMIRNGRVIDRHHMIDLVKKSIN